MNKLNILSLSLALVCLGAIFSCAQTDLGADKSKAVEKVKEELIKADVAETNLNSDPEIALKTNSNTNLKTNLKTKSAEGDQASIDKVKQGKLAFVKATCWGCHPHGDNAVNGDKPLKGDHFVRKYKSDSELAVVIRRGNEKAGMPPFPPEKLKEEDLRKIIFYVRSLSATSHGSVSTLESANGR